MPVTCRYCFKDTVVSPRPGALDICNECLEANLCYFCRNARATKAPPNPRSGLVIPTCDKCWNEQVGLAKTSSKASLGCFALVAAIVLALALVLRTDAGRQSVMWIVAGIVGLGAVAAFARRSKQSEPGKPAGAHAMWTELADELERGGAPKALVEGVRGAIAYTAVQPRRFLDNLRFLECSGMTFMLPSDQPKPAPTPSVAAKPDRPEWPLGHPMWFIAAFPDVSNWVSATNAAARFENDASAVALMEALDAKLTALIGQAGVSEDDEAAIKAILFDSDGKTGPKYARMLVEWYQESTGKPLETSLP